MAHKPIQIPPAQPASEIEAQQLGLQPVPKAMHYLGVMITAEALLHCRAGAKVDGLCNAVGQRMSAELPAGTNWTLSRSANNKTKPTYELTRPQADLQATRLR